MPRRVVNLGSTSSHHFTPTTARVVNVQRQQIIQSAPPQAVATFVRARPIATTPSVDPFDEPPQRYSHAVRARVVRFCIVFRVVVHK